jgi:hypothetical protein
MKNRTTKSSRAAGIFLLLAGGGNLIYMTSNALRHWGVIPFDAVTMSWVLWTLTSALSSVAFIVAGFAMIRMSSTE